MMGTPVNVVQMHAVYSEGHSRVYTDTLPLNQVRPHNVIHLSSKAVHGSY